MRAAVAHQKVGADAVNQIAILAQAMANKGYRIVSGGTDTHLFLMDVFSKGITGKVGEKALEAAGITARARK